MYRCCEVQAKIDRGMNKNKTHNMKRLTNILASIKAFFIRLVSNSAFVKVKDKNRADYIATESEMIDHLLNVVREQAIKNISLINTVKEKLQEGTATDYDFKLVKKETELLEFYENRRAKLK